MVTTDLHISEILKDVLPSLTPEQLKQLEENLVSDGRATDPILYWHFEGKSWIVDGMHRMPILLRRGIAYKTEPVEIEGGWKGAAIWILNRQKGRRNWTRKQIGECYNKLKGGWGGDHSKVSNDTLGDASEVVANSSGTSTSTVKRAGKRMELLGKCSDDVRKGIETDQFKVSDADVGTLAKLSAAQQNQIARDLRKKQANSVKESMKLRGIKAPAPARKKKAAKKKPGKKLDRGAYYKEWTKAIGPVVRLVDKIAGGVDEKESASHNTILDYLDNATAEMKRWMGVE